MADLLELESYPKAFTAAPGNYLSNLAEKDLSAFQAEAFGPTATDKNRYEILVAGRFSEGILYKWAPVELVTYGICRGSLIRATTKDVRALGKFAEGEDFALLDDLEEVIVCAPPLGGSHAFLLTELAWKDTRALEHAIKGLESLSIVASWTPSLIHTATALAFQRLRDEAREWWKATKVVTIAHPQTSWLIYTEGDDAEFSDKLTQLIQKYARSPTRAVHRPLPAPNLEKVHKLSQIVALADANQDSDLASQAIGILLTHPETITSVRAPEVFGQMKELALGFEAGQALEYLYHEELLSVDPGQARSAASTSKTKVRLDAPFVFSLEAAYVFADRGFKAAERLYPPTEAVTNLDTYLGGYLSHLDLSKSYITGSAAMSSVLRPPLRDLFATHAAFLDSYYSPTYTVLDKPEKLQHQILHHTWEKSKAAPYTFEAARCDTETGTVRQALRWSANKSLHDCAIIPGADVDIAVDAEGSDFDAIARSHFRAVRGRFPSATLVYVDRSKSHMYRIESSLPTGAEKGFRVVEIYQASWSEICTHHVGMVRLAYTEAGFCGDDSATDASGPSFQLTASCLKAAIELGTPNYYYFASRKTTPQEVMLKYAARGYSPACLPTRLGRNVLRFARRSSRWNPNNGVFTGNWEWFAQQPPAVSCRGNYNLKALHAEIEAFGIETIAHCC